MSADAIVLAIGVAAALVLALRGLRAHDLSFRRKATMAAVWIGIIAALALLLGLLRG